MTGCRWHSCNKIREKAEEEAEVRVAEPEEEGVADLMLVISAKARTLGPKLPRG